ncbi:transposase [Gluconobacter kondonii]|nr:transposase [Gluconobacter kondonii]
MVPPGSAAPWYPAGYSLTKGRSVPQKTDWRRYEDRNRIERMFNKLKQMRRIATRYDKTALSFMSFLNIAAARLWIESFVNET